MRALRQPEPLLRADEDVIPQPRLKVALHLGQVEVGAAAARQQFLGVVKEVEAKVEEGARHRLAVDEHVLFFKMPAAGADKQYGAASVQFVFLARSGVV